MLMRYPGGKTRLMPQLLKYFPSKYSEHREIFAGAGGALLPLLKVNPDINRLWINDINPGVAALWRAVFDPIEFDLLRAQISVFIPSVAEFQSLLSFTDAFSTLALHQMSYSGLGTMSGPIGGLSQTSKYSVGCRWSPKHLIDKLSGIHARLRQIQHVYITSLDFAECVERVTGFIYLDPPYYDQGPALYARAFTHADHVRLSECLKKSKNPWVLSYDDCTPIRDLYDWAQINTVDVGYTVANNTKQKTELVICPRC